MQAEIQPKVNPSVYLSSTPTLRTWSLLVNLVSGYGNPIVATIKELAEASRGGSRPIAARNIGKALKVLEKLGMITVQLSGTTRVITVVEK